MVAMMELLAGRSLANGKTLKELRGNEVRCIARTEQRL
jgi:hypothetical protein